MIWNECPDTQTRLHTARAAPCSGSSWGPAVLSNLSHFSWPCADPPFSWAISNLPRLYNGTVFRIIWLTASGSNLILCSEAGNWGQVTTQMNSNQWKNRDFGASKNAGIPHKSPQVISCANPECNLCLWPSCVWQLLVFSIAGKFQHNVST